jgi:hypothetical protein
VQATVAPVVVAVVKAAVQELAQQGKDMQVEVHRHCRTIPPVVVEALAQSAVTLRTQSTVLVVPVAQASRPQSLGPQLCAVEAVEDAPENNPPVLAEQAETAEAETAQRTLPTALQEPATRVVAVVADYSTTMRYGAAVGRVVLVLSLFDGLHLHTGRQHQPLVRQRTMAAQAATISTLLPLRVQSLFDAHGL